MVAPITGPITQTTWLLTPSQPDIYDYFSSKDRYRQVRPYDLPLPYRHKWACLRGSREGVEAAGAGYSASLAADWATLSTAEFNDLVSRAYDKLKSDFAGSAELGAAIATFRQSLGMVTNRALQLLRFGRHLKKGRFSQAARELSWPTGRPLPRGAKYPPRAKDFGSMWLEWSYGWLPAIQDIYNALEVLGKTDFGTRLIKGRAKLDQTASDGSLDPWSQLKTYKGEVSLKMGTRVRIENPNLVLWNQLGLINPATIIYEVIPYSFFVDWLVNAQQFLQSGTDWLGVQRSHEFTTIHWRGVVKSEWGQPPGGKATFDVMRLYRKQGIDKPSLYVKPLRVWGWQRGLNAASLLTRFLKSV